jgi:Arc/MetJ-type ribon-helix-helix transcriptional regulator
MDQVQLRMSRGLVQQVDCLVKSGLYSTRSDVIRDAVRRLILDRMTGTIPNTGDSVTEVRNMRKKLSKQIKSAKDVLELNKLAD